MRLLASVGPPLAHGLVLSAALVRILSRAPRPAAWATAAASPNISNTGNDEGSLGMGRDHSGARLVTRGSVRSSALALERALALAQALVRASALALVWVLAWVLARASATLMCGPWLYA